MVQRLVYVPVGCGVSVFTPNQDLVDVRTSFGGESVSYLETPAPTGAFWRCESVGDYQLEIELTAPLKIPFFEVALHFSMTGHPPPPPPMVYDRYALEHGDLIKYLINAYET